MHVPKQTDSLGDKSNVISGWVGLLTFTLPHYDGYDIFCSLLQRS
jgi:hypothetical protein